MPVIQKGNEMKIFWGVGENVVIINHPTGIIYYGQVGGMACAHPEIEGFILPLNWQNWSVLENLSCPEACMGCEIDEKLYEKLLSAWPSQDRELYKVILDKERISEGTECWFPIRIEKGIKPSQYSIEDKELQDFLVGKKGFLLMSDNCD